MLLEFELGIVRQLVIDVEDYVVFRPVTVHIHHSWTAGAPACDLYLQRSTPAFSPCCLHLPDKANCQLLLHRIGANALLSFCVARNSVFLAVSAVVFSISPIVRSRSP